MQPKQFTQDVTQEETSWITLDTQGTIPSDLVGQLTRIGPGKFTMGTDTLNHWFDGFAHLVGIRISKASILFKNKFLETHSYTQSSQQKKNAGFMFATRPSTSWESMWQFMSNLPRYVLPMLPQWSTKNMDNTNVNIIPNKHNKLVASPRPLNTQNLMSVSIPWGDIDIVGYLDKSRLPTRRLTSTTFTTSSSR